jgi:hypothetical protein
MPLPTASSCSASGRAARSPLSRRQCAGRYGADSVECISLVVKVSAISKHPWALSGRPRPGGRQPVGVAHGVPVARALFTGWLHIPLHPGVPAAGSLLAWCVPCACMSSRFFKDRSVPAAQRRPGHRGFTAVRTAECPREYTVLMVVDRQGAEVRRRRACRASAANRVPRSSGRGRPGRRGCSGGSHSRTAWRWS